VAGHSGAESSGVPSERSESWGTDAVANA
jgi:hypothetical protein